MRRAEELGGELPATMEPPPVATPCRRCPKHALYPDNYGLHPNNELAVQIYRDVAEDQRIGTFTGAPLVRTLKPGTAIDAMEMLWSEYLPTEQSRREMMRKLLILDEVATDTRSDIEERNAATRRAAAKNEGDGTSKERR